jgi:hypothetical protein
MKLVTKMENVYVYKGIPMPRGKWYKYVKVTGALNIKCEFSFGEITISEDRTDPSHRVTVQCFC